MDVKAEKLALFRYALIAPLAITQQYDHMRLADWNHNVVSQALEPRLRK